MNCLTFSLLFRILYGGKLTILKWGLPWPHFCVVFGKWAVHYKSTDDPNLPWYRQLHFRGREHWEWLGRG